MQHMKHVTLALKPHTCTGPMLCALCGSETEPRTPIDLFLAGTSDLVCTGCAGKYAPDLVWLMDFFYRGHYVEPAYDEIEAQLGAIRDIASHLNTEDMDALEQDLQGLARRMAALKERIAAHQAARDEA